MENLVLEPLSKATQTTLAPLDLRETDYLKIDLDPKEGKKFILELQCLIKGEVQSWPGPSSRAQAFFRRLPECTWLGRRDLNKKNTYLAGATDFSALVIANAWPVERIIFATEEAKIIYTHLIVRFLAQTERATMQAAYKLSGVLPEKPSDWVDHSKLPLADYQRVGVQFCLGQEAAGLLMDKGTGKTATSIQRICMEANRHRRKNNKMYRVLIVCPQQVCINWQSEIARFATARGKVVVVRGTQFQRIKAITHGIESEDNLAFSAVIVAYDSLVASEPFFLGVPWDLVVLDESHHAKSPKTDRWKTLVKLREVARARQILTASPIGNNPMDLWTQLEFLGQGLSGFQSFKSFRDFHGVFEQVGSEASGIDRLVATDNIPLLQERLARLTYTITKKDAGLQLPDKVYDVYEVTMTSKQAEIYNQVATQLAAEIEDAMSGETDAMTINHVLTSLLRLGQITSGFVTTDAKFNEDGVETKPKTVKQIDYATNPKLNAVVEMLKDPERDPNGKTIIWAIYREDIRVLSKRLTEEGIKHGLYYGKIPMNEREAVVQAFNKDPETRVIICNLQSAGEGLNLLGYDWENPEGSKTYCDHEIFYSQNWSAILRGQAEDRAHRRGTRMPVRITDLVIPGTIDEEIRERVQGKQAMADLVTNIKSILEKVLYSR